MIEIPLTQGHIALVDDEDSHLADFRWYAHINSKGAWSARRTVKVGTNKWTKVALHRAVLGYPKGQIIDHKNGNPFDCRRANLRIATYSQNTANRRANPGSKFKGVRQKKTGWEAIITWQRRVRWLGSYRTAEDAARAYDAAARELHGEFACVNFPRPGERGAATDPIPPAPCTPAPGWRPASSYLATGCCRRGHPLEPGSVAIRTNERGYQYRTCKVCDRERHRKKEAA